MLKLQKITTAIPSGEYHDGGRPKLTWHCEPLWLRPSDITAVEPTPYADGSVRAMVRTGSGGFYAVFEAPETVVAALA